MNAWSLLLPVSLAAVFVAAPQDPVAAPARPTASGDTAAVVSLSELRYTTPQGTAQTISSRTVVEIRLLEDHPNSIRLELLFENGDYSMIDAQAFELLRNGGNTREVRLVRSKVAGMRFPRLP